MNISQDSFNKIVSIMLLAYGIAMSTYSIITGKEVNFSAIASFTVFVITHVGHLVYNVTNTNTSVKAASSQIDPAQVAALKDVVSGSATPIPPNTSPTTTNGLH